VRAGGFDAGFGNPRVQVGFTDAGDPLIGVDEHDDVVLG
jgi:hypothetical protein